MIIILFGKKWFISVESSCGASEGIPIKKIRWSRFYLHYFIAIMRFTIPGITVLKLCWRPAYSHPWVTPCKWQLPRDTLRYGTLIPTDTLSTWWGVLRKKALVQIDRFMIHSEFSAISFMSSNIFIIIFSHIIDLCKKIEKKTIKETDLTLWWNFWGTILLICSNQYLMISQQ